jgi:hypothetical protein
MQVEQAAMEHDAQIVIRVPQDMADQLKEYSAKLSRDFGVPVSLAAATRRLLAEGLERAGFAASDSGAETSDAKRAPARKPKR